MPTDGVAASLVLDEQGRASLDGEWDFHPGPWVRHQLDGRTPQRIRVPALWEAEGHLELDGVAWYRRHFSVSDTAGFWSLRFGAVMDIADVYLNDHFLGRHEHPFTPFRFTATHALRTGENVLDVRVTDPPVDDPEHLRLAHGKQGWANHVFPSRPSLYLTYGGIWQPVLLRRHGQVIVDDVFVEADPDDLVITAEVTNTADSPVTARVCLRAVGRLHEEEVELAAGDTARVRWAAGPTRAARWQPESPVLHEVLADVRVGGALSDQRRERFGLRTVRLDGDRMFVGDRPYRMKSALVQGFTADRLYAEGTREEITAEVRAAQSMGFNTLRLHIKAFDPVYLEVCDELGMLLHCDLPVAEPIAHDELGDGTLLSARAVEAVTEQVRRDRNHPSIVLWSAMNELGLDREGARETKAYEQFARTLYRAVTAADPTRPVIENDWVEPDPDRVFHSPVLTAHWYGRLHTAYLRALEEKTAAWAGTGRPLFVSEFGDWGMPEMPEISGAPFWDARELYQAGLAFSRWPDTVGRFVTETQRYQGLSDRLQAEIFRRHQHIGGYCLTELTDVPHEFNGVLDLHRRPKAQAVDEVARMNQQCLPMLRLDNLLIAAGDRLDAGVVIANDGPALDDVVLEIRFGDAAAPAPDRRAAFLPAGEQPYESAAWVSGSVHTTHIGRLPGHRTRDCDAVSLIAPTVPGNHDLLLLLLRGDTTVAENRYPIHVVAAPAAPYGVRLIGDDSFVDVLAGLGARCGDTGPTIVGEGALTAEITSELRRRLTDGGTVLVLAQEPAAAGHYPEAITLTAVETAWGSSVFHFTTDTGALPSMPRRNMLVGEDSTVQATSAITGVGGDVFPDEPMVIAFKPMPGTITGTVVGAHAVGRGRLLLCQYRLARAAGAGDTAARALLADLIRAAATPRPAAERRTVHTGDGRSVSFYSWDSA